MRRVAVIPARGGSKRLPGKNIIDFFGKPILGYTVEAAKATGLFERVVVSTEDSEIAAVAGRYCEVVIRPEHLATDTARVVDVCLDFLDQEESRENKYDVMCCLYATSPLRTDRDILGVNSLLERGSCGFGMAVSPYALPPHQALVVGATGELVPMWPELVERQSQEVPRLVCDNGSTYAVFVDEFRAARSFYGPGLRGYEMPVMRSVDIDEPGDLEVACAFARREGC